MPAKKKDAITLALQQPPNTSQPPQETPIQELPPQNVQVHAPMQSLPPVHATHVQQPAHPGPQILVPSQDSHASHTAAPLLNPQGSSSIRLPKHALALLQPEGFTGIYLEQFNADSQDIPFCGFRLLEHFADADSVFHGSSPYQRLALLRSERSFIVPDLPRKPLCLCIRTSRAIIKGSPVQQRIVFEASPQIESIPFQFTIPIIPHVIVPFPNTQVTHEDPDIAETIKHAMLDALSKPQRFAPTKFYVNLLKDTFSVSGGTICPLRLLTHAHRTRISVILQPDQQPHSVVQKLLSCTHIQSVHLQGKTIRATCKQATFTAATINLIQSIVLAKNILTDCHFPRVRDNVSDTTSVGPITPRPIIRQPLWALSLITGGAIPPSIIDSVAKTLHLLPAKVRRNTTSSFLLTLDPAWQETSPPDILRVGDLLVLTKVIAQEGTALHVHF